MTVPLYTLKRDLHFTRKLKYTYSGCPLLGFDYSSRLNDDGRVKLRTDQLMSLNHIWSCVSHEEAALDVLTYCSLW